MQFLSCIVHDGVDKEHGIDMAGLMTKRKTIYRVDVPPHQLLQAAVREPLRQRVFQPLMVYTLEEVPDVALDDCAVRIVPFLYRFGGKSGGAPCGLVRSLFP